MNETFSSQTSLWNAAPCATLVSTSSFVIIPARYASTRLPRKMLLAETGKPLIQHTYEAALKATSPGGVCIATDHEEIFSAARRFGASVFMTAEDLPSGTDRVAEVCRRLPDVEIVVNVQGDEPEIDHAHIDRAIGALVADPRAVMSTLATPIRSQQQFMDPACVKVVCDGAGRAMYFSRAPIPFFRDTPPTFEPASGDGPLQHIGLYAYRRNFLLEMAQWPTSRLEKTEKLEQLRVLERGASISVVVVEHATRGVDTPDDYLAFVQRTRGE